MDIVFVLAASAAIIWYLRNITYWVYLWQAKEYRLDRMLIHLFETAQGRSLLFSPLSCIKWIGVAFYVVTIFHDSYLELFHVCIVVLYIFEAFLVCKEFFLGQLRRPEFTAKALSLIIFSILTAMLFFAVPLVDKFSWILLIDRLLFLIVGFFVFLHSFPTELYHDTKINKAIKKLRTHKDMMVIGISGSYGKSSTKEFIAQVLSKKFVVAKTRGNQHTLGGIADVVLRKITKKTQVFVAEMGAYGRGEIATMCYVIKPNIGVVTGINDQHLSLFHTVQNSVAAKNELIESLPKKGVALFNGDDQEAVKLYKKTRIQKVLYAKSKLIDHSSVTPEISATDISVKKSSISFTIHLKKKKFSVTAPLLGSHNIVNLLPAIYIADYFGITQSEIKRIILHLIPLQNTMTRRLTEGGLTVIDDTYNSNPESIAAALAYMKIYKKKRFFVLQPMIELGKNAKEQHLKIGQLFADSCDVLLLTNKNYLTQIKRGIAEKKGKCKVLVGSTGKISSYLGKNVKRGDIVFCEGNEAKRIVEILCD